jgi:hypothetical protein
MTWQTPPKAGGVFLPTVTNAFEHRSHARSACYFCCFRVLQQTAIGCRGINTIRVEN